MRGQRGPLRAISRSRSSHSRADDCDCSSSPRFFHRNTHLGEGGFDRAERPENHVWVEVAHVADPYGSIRKLVKTDAQSYSAVLFGYPTEFCRVDLTGVDRRDRVRTICGV